ncbi:Clathrin light chain [Armadillidium vulgare]|nr:Clathrin light chain [Armadillidium vulgare]
MDLVMILFPLKNQLRMIPQQNFLAREQNELAGLDDDLASKIAQPTELTNSVTPPVITNGAFESELFGDVPTDVQEGPNYDLFPEHANGKAPSPIPVVREEPEKIRLWREQQEKRLEEKDAAEELSKEELREKAAKELEEWYKQHEEQVTKTRQANRSAEKELVADTTKMEPGTEWERIAKLCDFNPKTSKSSRDISRMRSIILQVKQNPPIKA